MKEDYQIWNILHDGGFVDIQGNVPGELTIKVEIAYLANKLKGSFDNILVTLSDCTIFEYERYWSKNKTQTYTSIEELNRVSPGLEVLSCDEENDYLLIADICGTIKVKYHSAKLTLENGNPLSFEELASVSKEYWENFGATTAKSNT